MWQNFKLGDWMFLAKMHLGSLTWTFHGHKCVLALFLLMCYDSTTKISIGKNEWDNYFGKQDVQKPSHFTNLLKIFVLNLYSKLQYVYCFIISATANSVHVVWSRGLHKSANKDLTKDQSQVRCKLYLFELDLVRLSGSGRDPCGGWNNWLK